jgi:glucuronokinase
MTIHTRAFARAGLVGNPSDGYGGKTIAFAIREFAAEVELTESSRIEILPNDRDRLDFASLAALVEDVRQFGYYGGIRLLKATLKRFYDYCWENQIALSDRGFKLRYASNIPNLVGLAGSSAIVTACLRALMEFYGVTIAKPAQPSLVLSVENRELGIPAGLQDRVAQVYEGLVYMDFDPAYQELHGHGRYEELDPCWLPPLYIAYRRDLAEGTEVHHSNLRERFNRGEPAVLDAVKFWAALTDQVRERLLSGQGASIGPLLDANFDRRREVCTDQKGRCSISEGNLRLVAAARSCGASAKFTGSGGAIVGTYPDEAAFARLRQTLGALDIEVFKPTIVPTPAS